MSVRIYRFKLSIHIYLVKTYSYTIIANGAISLATLLIYSSIDVE